MAPRSSAPEPTFCAATFACPHGNTHDADWRATCAWAAWDERIRRVLSDLLAAEWSHQRTRESCTTCFIAT